MRALIVVVIASCAIPLAFLSPLLGLMAYCWLSYMRPTELAWGISHISFGLYTAVALFAGLFVRMRWNFFRGSPITYLMLALWVLWGLSAWFAIDREVGLGAFKQISTIFLICLVTTGLCTDRKKLNLILWAIIGSLAFHGVKHGIFGLMNPGASMNDGIGGMMSGNNENAIAFNFAFPFLVYMGFEPKAKWKRYAFWAAAFLTAMAVFFSHSRGGALGLAAAVAVIVWRTRARLLGILFGLPAAIVGFFTLAPDSMVERMSGIRQATQSDLSVLYRFQAWEVAWGITLRHPLLGIGPKNFVDEFRRFPHPPDLPRMEVHNTYLELASGNGIPALLLYLALAFVAFRTCTKIVKEVQRRGDPSLSWYANVARGAQAAMAAYLVSSTFGSMAHFDLLYHVAALVACIPVALKHELDSRQQQQRAAAEAALSVAPEASSVVAAAVAATVPRRRVDPDWHVATTSRVSPPLPPEQPAPEPETASPASAERIALPEARGVRILPVEDRTSVRGPSPLPATDRVRPIGPETRFWDVGRGAETADETPSDDASEYDEFLLDMTYTHLGDTPARVEEEPAPVDDALVTNLVADEAPRPAARTGFLGAVRRCIDDLVVVAPRS